MRARRAWPLGAAAAVAAVIVALTSSSPQAQGPPTDPPTPQEGLAAFGITAYADKLSVQPGESIGFHVSTESDSYRAQIVRMFHGDGNPRGPGIKEQVVNAPVNRDYPGEEQPFVLGSYGEVPDDAALRPSGSFTITAWIAPTTVPGSSLNPLAFRRSPAHTPRPQGIVSKWSDDAGQGYALVVDEDGSLALWLGAGGRVEKHRTGVALRPWVPAQGGADANRPRPQGTNSTWYFVAASYDARSGRVTLVQEPQSELPDDTRTAVERSSGIRTVRHSDGPLLMAAYGESSDEVAGHFNGKIDSPRVFPGRLSRRQLDAVREGASPRDPVAAWDFSRAMSGSRIVDASSNGLDGRAVNLPTRAVTGHNWTADEQDFKRARDQYGAIYFHEDDLEDAGWKRSFTYRLPDDLPSGFYAAKLTAADGRVYYSPFFVTPKDGRPTSKIAFLVPTFSYMSYAETAMPASLTQYEMSQYSRHSDGSGWVYSTRLRPYTSMRPDDRGPNGRPWQWEADTHIVDWFREAGFKVDIITDHELHDQGAELLEPYNVVMSGTHPEYTSEQHLDAFNEYLHEGGRVMYMGGNGWYWVTSPNKTGTYTEVRRHDGSEAWQAAPGEYYHSTTGEYGGLWRFRGRPPQQLFGVGFTAQGFDRSRPYTRLPASEDPRAAFVFDGVPAGEQFGAGPSLQLPGGAAGEELDRVDPALGTPANTLVLAEATGFSDAYQHVVEEVNTSDSLQGGTVNRLVKADMTLTYYPRGGAVFSTSSISWAGSLFADNYGSDISRITGNVLRAFAANRDLPGARQAASRTAAASGAGSANSGGATSR